MSTKDIRFILPIFPYLCLLSSLFINALRNKNWIIIYKISLIFLLIINISFHLGSKKIAENKMLNYPHREIVSSISNYSPRLNSVVAVIPDTKELNTFNLEAEAALQNNGVTFRQVISNESNYKEDLERFNWFLIKDNGNQGVMINNAKRKLSELVESSKSFEIFNSFSLPDGSNAKIYKRKKDNIFLKEIKDNDDTLMLDINKITNGFKIKLKGKKDLLDESFILINIGQNEEIYELNVLLPKIKDIPETDNILIEKNFKSNLFSEFKTSRKITGILITKNDRRIKLDNISYIDIENQEKNFNNPQILEVNTLEELEKMGKFLRYGKFDSLFSLVGLINQADPEQNYLKDGELIFKERLKLDSNNYEYLYNIAIAQILQKKAREASITLEKIIKFEPKNANLYLAKSIVEIYNMQPRKANIYIKETKKLNKDKNLISTIEIVNLLTEIINFKFKAFINIIF